MFCVWFFPQRNQTKVRTINDWWCTSKVSIQHQTIYSTIHFSVVQYTASVYLTLNQTKFVRLGWMTQEMRVYFREREETLKAIQPTWIWGRSRWSEGVRQAQLWGVFCQAAGVRVWDRHSSGESSARLLYCDRMYYHFCLWLIMSYFIDLLKKIKCLCYLVRHIMIVWCDTGEVDKKKENHQNAGKYQHVQMKQPTRDSPPKYRNSSGSSI